MSAPGRRRGGPPEPHQPFLARFSVLLLDMNGTFMFGHDRFGPGEDYHATYRALGGRVLTREALQGAVSRACETLWAAYEDPQRHDSFPSVRAALAALPGSCDLPDAELALVEAMIAEHERGFVPPAYAALLRRLARTHRLALVSNLWSRKDRWVDALAENGLLDLFAATLFSSDGGSVKPSPAIFEQALAALGVPREAAVVVGDSLRCDVGGAHAAGLASVWIDPHGAGAAAGEPRPDRVIRDLGDLV